MRGLAVALTSAGLNVMGDGLADTKSTIELLRLVQKNNEPFIIIAAIDDPSLRSWATLHASMGVPVLIARSEIFARGDNIPQSRIIDLPCTVNEIMANFGATLDAKYGDIEIDTDGRAMSDAPVSQGDPFNVFGTLAPQQIEESSEIMPITSDDVDDVFGATSPTPPSIFAAPPPSDTASEVNVFAKVVAPAEIRDGDVFATQQIDNLNPMSVVPSSTDRDLTDILGAEPELLPPPVPAQAPSAEVRRDLPTPVRREDLAESMFTRTRPTTSTNERRAKVVFVFAGKGGVGKSTATISLAERAATVVSGLRVIAVDANRGQGDMRTFLKLDGADVPSIYDAAVSRNPDVFRDVLINPKRLSGHRVDRAPIHIGVILSPEKDQSDPSVVTSQVYAKAIEYAKTKADLVFIDTQIVESFDTSGIIDDVIVPSLLDGAWGLGLADSSTPGVQNLMWVLNNFVERGVSTSRLMVALNKVAPDSLIDADTMSQYVERYATWMGIAATDPLVEHTLNLGELPGSSSVGATPEFTALLDRVLFHITGITTFSQISNNTPPSKTRIKSPRRFARRR
jgi:MinD-like ATPase involved in chromosome partitioning or flagellar assembly